MPLSDARLRTYALRGSERLLKQRVQERPGRGPLVGALVGPLDLPGDLRLADDHAVEARRDAEQMPNRLVIAALDQARTQLGGFQVVEFAQELGPQIGRRLRLLRRAGEVKLDAV